MVQSQFIITKIQHTKPENNYTKQEKRQREILTSIYLISVFCSIIKQKPKHFYISSSK